MTNKYLLGGVAGVALLAATGAANAADVMPVVPPPVVVVTPPVVVPGPVFSFEVEQILFAEKDNTDPVELWMGTFAKVGVTTARGLGIELTYDSEYDIAWPLDGEFTLGARVSKTLANLGIGVFATIEGGFPFAGFSDPEAGFDLTFTAGRLTFESVTTFELAGPFAFDVENTATFALSDMLEVFVTAETDFPGFDTDVGGGATVTLGPISPYVNVAWDISAAVWQANVGTDLELPLGTSPFTLVGNANYSFGTDDGRILSAAVGFRFTH